MNMTQEIWDKTPEPQKEKLRDLSGLNKELVGLEGWRIEVETMYGETRRFYVSRSAGWRPCHIEILTRRSSGGRATDRAYKSIRKLYRK